MISCDKGKISLEGNLSEIEADLCYVVMNFREILVKETSNEIVKMFEDFVENDLVRVAKGVDILEDITDEDKDN